MKMKPLSLMVGAILAATALTAHAETGLSSSAAPLIQSVAADVGLTSILTAADKAANGYRMVGLPDGLGAYSLNARNFVVLMNHELGNTVGVPRAHGGIGAFVSEWVINKKTLQVVSGGDLIHEVYNWNTAAQANDTTPSTISFNRFCSADLADETAFYNAKTKKGTKARIFLNGEEGGTTGYALAHVATGKSKGKSYVLGKFNLKTNGANVDAVGGWENLLANPYSGEKTVVVGNNDGGTGIMLNTVVVYVGDKTKTGTDVEKAGLTNGKALFVNVQGAFDALGTTNDELASTTDRTTKIVSGTPFTLGSATATTFSRPEDGAWADATHFYFVTTDQLDQTDLAGKTQKGGTRLWRLNFNADYTGGTIDVVLDSATIPGGLANQKPNMFDNISVNSDKTISLLEDVGNAEHNGKTWLFDLTNGAKSIQTKFDPALFGDISATGVFTAGTHTKDEETSGIIDVTKILNRHDKKVYNLLVSQDHALAADLQKIKAIDPTANPVEIYEGGQLLLQVRNKAH
ncbi:MAG TPA: hypothetical protein DCY52_01170 [Methylococcaceae bacterium]|nr:hypothetical protein [Methylococcaceae bacterium]